MSYSWKHTVPSLLLWLLSLVIHMCISSMSFCGLITHCLDVLQFTHSPAEGHLASKFGPIMSKAPVNIITVQDFVST